MKKENRKRQVVIERKQIRKKGKLAEEREKGERQTIRTAWRRSGRRKK